MNTDRRKSVLADLEVTPRALGSVPAGADGQLAPVTDRPGRNLYLREAGNLVASIDVDRVIRTDNAAQLDMTVNPSTGVSPPAGTTIYSQAEYDALGSPLRYIQDVFDVLPHTLGHYVNVTLAAGNYVQKPGSSGYPGFDLVLAQQMGRFADARSKPLEADTLAGQNVIQFNGQLGVVEAEQAGAHNIGVLDSIVRTSGTWTVHEHIGKFARIVTGAGAGLIACIADNDTTTLYLQGSSASSGACTFEIVEPTSIVAPTSFYTAMADNTGLTYQWNNVKFGTAVSKIGTLFLIGSWQFRNCQFFINGEISTFRGEDRASDFIFSASYIEAGLTARWQMTRMYLTGCVFSTANANKLFVDDGARVLLGTNTFRIPTGSSFSGNIVEVIDGILTDNYHNTFIGQSSGTGLYIGPAGYMRAANTLVFTNLSNAASFVGTRARMSGTLSGSGNTNGFVLSKGGQIQVANPSGLGATNEIVIDGVTHPYTDLPSAGDYIEGQNGSKIGRD